jgi:hypothetical protein
MKFKDIPESNGSKNYIKLKDKESVEGIFMGELHDFRILWENGRSSVVAEGTPKSSFRFRVNFVTKEGPTFVAKIFENGIGVYRQLAELHAEYNLEETIVKITRNGVGQDTAYSILPLLKKQMTKETTEHLKTIQLNDLKTEITAVKSEVNDDIPF